MKTRERRLKILTVTKELILQMLIQDKVEKGLVHLISTSEELGDCEIADIHYDWRYDSFSFKLYNVSFPIVLDGYEAPRIYDHMIEIKKFREIKNEKTTT